MQHTRSRQLGASMLEVALAVVLISVIFMGMTPLILKNQDVTVAKSISQSYTQFWTAASAHFEANRSAYISAMTDGTGADQLCKVNVDSMTGAGGEETYSADVHRCALDTSMLKFVSALPASVSDTNAYGERWVAIYKLVYDQQSPPQPTGGVEQLVVSAAVHGQELTFAPSTSTYDRALTAAGFTSGSAGVVPDADRSTCVASRSSGVFEACGSGWRINLADYLSAAELQAFANRLMN